MTLETSQETQEESNDTSTTTDPQLDSLSAFAQFLHVDTTKETNDITAVIDAILAKFEEFCTVIELIRMESKDLLFTTSPVLHERCKQLQPIFTQTDILENF